MRITVVATLASGRPDASGTLELPVELELQPGCVADDLAIAVRAWLPVPEQPRVPKLYLGNRWLAPDEPVCGPGAAQPLSDGARLGVGRAAGTPATLRGRPAPAGARLEVVGGLGCGEVFPLRLGTQELGWDVMGALQLPVTTGVPFARLSVDHRGNVVLQAIRDGCVLLPDAGGLQQLVTDQPWLWPAGVPVWTDDCLLRVGHPAAHRAPSTSPDAVPADPVQLLELGWAAAPAGRNRLRIGTGLPRRPGRFTGVEPGSPYVIDIPSGGGIGICGEPTIGAALARWLVAQMILEAQGRIHFDVRCTPGRRSAWDWLPVTAEPVQREVVVLDGVLGAGTPDTEPPPKATEVDRTVLVVEESENALPDNCRIVLACTERGLLIRGAGPREHDGVLPDQVDLVWCSRFRAALGPVVVVPSRAAAAGADPGPVPVRPPAAAGPPHLAAEPRPVTEPRAAMTDVPAPGGPLPVPRPVVMRDLLLALPPDHRVPGAALLGVRGEPEAPLLVRPADSPGGYLILGPPGSGRTTALAGFAVSLLASGTWVLIVSDAGSPLARLATHPLALVRSPAGPELPRAVRETVGMTTGPAVVLIDDADRLDAVTELTGLASTRVGVVLAGECGPLSVALASGSGQAPGRRHGLALAPWKDDARDLLGLSRDVQVDIPADPGGGGRGIGLTAVDGRPVAVRIPLTALR